MRSTEEIVHLYRLRQSGYDPIFSEMREVRDVAQGDVVLPLPELDESQKPLAINLVSQGLHQMAMRAASVVPDIYCPPVRKGDEAEARADDRRRAAFGWWEHNNMDLILRKRARHFLAYATTPVVMRIDFSRRIPEWEVRDPLDCYPSDHSQTDPTALDDCVFTFAQTWSWLDRTYPEAAARLSRSKHTRPEETITIIEYFDAEDVVLIALGEKQTGVKSLKKVPGAHQMAVPGSYMPTGNMGAPALAVPRGWKDVHGKLGSVEHIELLRFQHRLDRVPVVVPGRISLDRIQSQFYQMLGMYYGRSELMALSMIATRRGVFPEQWLVSNDNTQADIITQADSRQGIVGIVKGGTLETVKLDPSFMVNPMMNLLEGNERAQGSIPSEFSGMASTNVRTGQRGGQILSATVDFPIQEAQLVFSRSLQAETRIGVDIVKKWFGSEKKSFHITWGKARGRVDYVPQKTFETDELYVSFPAPGTDAQSLIIALGQRIATEMMSLETARRVDPMIEDPKQEGINITREALERAILASIQAQLQDPAGPISIPMAAKMIKLIDQGKLSLVDAISQVQEEEQERQAQMQQGQLQGAEVQPGIGGAAELQGLPSVGTPNPSGLNLANALANLRRPQMQIEGG